LCLALKAKEGLALTNGSQTMTAVAALMVHYANVLANCAERSGALSFDVLQGLVEAFDKRIHESRPHPGQIQSAEHMLQLLEGSKLVGSGDERVRKGLHR
jgi:histidine ammonia-lyase